jgi:hypothetical protein
MPRAFARSLNRSRSSGASRIYVRSFRTTLARVTASATSGPVAICSIASTSWRTSADSVICRCKEISAAAPESRRTRDIEARPAELWRVIVEQKRPRGYPAFSPSCCTLQPLTLHDSDGFSLVSRHDEGAPARVAMNAQPREKSALEPQRAQIAATRGRRLTALCLLRWQQAGHRADLRSSSRQDVGSRGLTLGRRAVPLPLAIWLAALPGLLQ